MKKIINLLSIVLLAMICVLLVSCKNKKLKLGTGNINGNYYNYGIELANELKTNCGIKVTPMESTGSLANLNLVSEGFYDIGIVQSNDLAEAQLNGNDKGYHYSKSLFTEYFQIIVRYSSSIETINDLIGKKVSIGEEESGTHSVSLKVLESALGDDYKKIGLIDEDFTSSAQLLQNGEIDAMIIVSSGATNAIKSIEEEVALRYISLNDSAYNGVVKANSGYVKTLIPANTLVGQEDAIETIGVYAVLVFNDNVDSEVEEDILEYIEDNNEGIMDISFDKDIPEKGVYRLYLNMYLTLCFGILVLFLGVFLRKKIKFFEKFCIPAPVIGGLIVSIITLVLYIFKIIEIDFDETFKNIAMMIFFTSVGFQANVRVLKKGGICLIKLFACIFVLIFLQNLTSVGLSKVLKVDALVALCTGSISMVGGHGTAGAFGGVLEQMGVSGATVIATAAATFGLVAGSIMGGPLGSRLIKKYNLKSTDEVIDEEKEEVEKVSIIKSYAPAIYQLAIAMGIGSIVSYLLSLTGLSFPAYIGSMVVAAVMRNISEYGKKWETPMKEIDDVGSISLGIFLSIAMISLKLWQLADLALPMIILLVAQVVLCFLFARFVLFYVMGKNYDAAVIVAGSCGFSMGATPNAMANMDSITSKHGPSIQAYLVVPIIGAVLMDFVNVIVITLFMNLF